MNFKEDTLAGKTTTLYELVLSSSRRGLELQRRDGSMPAGHNGPYHDPETAVRNTAHWLITYCRAYRLTGGQDYREAAQKAAEYLCAGAVRPHQATFRCRRSEKDCCNGLIGQAWVVEALAEAGPVLDNHRLVDLAREVYLLHPFEASFGLWHRVEIDGTILPVDLTLNHQLWFAAAGARLAPHADAEVAARVGRFLDHLPYNLRLYPSGLICHLIKKPSVAAMRLGSIKTVKGILRRWHDLISLKEKAIGYHAYNLYALAVLKQFAPQHPFWDSGQFGLLWHYALSAEYEKKLDHNRYGWPYNPPGLEMAYALQVFGGEETLIKKWLTAQITRSFDFACGLMQVGSVDPVTYAARIYEATRLNDLTLELETR